MSVQDEGEQMVVAPAAVAAEAKRSGDVPRSASAQPAGMNKTDREHSPDGIKAAVRARERGPSGSMLAEKFRRAKVRGRWTKQDGGQKDGGRASSFVGPPTGEPDAIGRRWALNLVSSDVQREGGSRSKGAARRRLNERRPAGLLFGQSA